MMENLTGQRLSSHNRYLLIIADVLGCCSELHGYVAEVVYMSQASRALQSRPEENNMKCITHGKARRE